MENSKISEVEKTALTDLARKLVERSIRSQSEQNSEPSTTESPNDFSEEGRLRRILDLEKQIQKINQDWSKTLNTVLFTVERLEARVARLEGEIPNIYQKYETHETQVELHRQEMECSALSFTELASASLAKALSRVEALLSENMRSPKQTTTPDNNLTDNAK